jgi:methanogenic corrinoid protein MtbC1
MFEGSATGLAREAYTRALAVAGAHQERLPPDALAALAAHVVTVLSSRLPEQGLIEQQVPERGFQEFVQTLLSEDPHRAADIIDAARADGLVLETIYLGYLARAARELGELWDQDQVDFVQVTVAVGHIYAIMRGLRPARPLVEDPRRHALFVTMPGDDHLLGASIATDLFRARGWDIQLLAPKDQADAIDTLANSNHAVVAVAASSVEQLPELVQMVVGLHICRPEAFVLVSGHITESVPDLLNLIDADAIATTAPEAIDRLESLIAYQQRVAVARNPKTV